LTFANTKLLNLNMDAKLKKYRCPKCTTSLGALLLKASGNAIVQLKCWRCKNFVEIEINTGPEEYEDAKELAKANN